MAKHFTSEEIAQIVEMREVQKLAYADIAIKLNRYNKKQEPNARAIMEQYSQFKREQQLAQITELPMPSGEMPPLIPQNVALDEKSSRVERFAGEAKIVTVQTKPPISGTVESEDEVNLSELSRAKRYEHLRANLTKSAKGKHTFNKILSPDESKLFCQEYFKVMREQDSLTNAEEQQLFAAILNYVLYHRALELDQKARMDWENKVPGVQHYDTRWQKEYNDRYNQYESGMKALKLSREQRLKDLSRIGTSFLDFTEAFARRENQEAFADEIMKIETMTEEEIFRLQKNGWMVFGGSPNNNFEVNYSNDDTK